MPVNFYLHTPLPDQLSERRALIHIARQLYRQAAASKLTYSLIANINPDQDPLLGTAPQLDALLLAPHFAALLEFKAYFDPIIGRHLTGNWFAINRKNKQQVRGGSQRNPYLQLKNAKTRWQAQLNLPLHAFLLFYPYLHPNSQLPRLDQQHSWLAIQSIDEIKALLLTTRTNNLLLDGPKQKEIAEKLLHCRPWAIEPLLVQISGYLHVLEPDQPLIRYPIQPFSSFTIGRSKRVNHLIHLNSPQISSTHAYLFMNGNDLIIEDLNSKNGLFYKGKRLNSQFALPPNEVLSLGGTDSATPQIWYSPHLEGQPSNPTLPTY